MDDATIVSEGTCPVRSLACPALSSSPTVVILNEVKDPLALRQQSLRRPYALDDAPYRWDRDVLVAGFSDNATKVSHPMKLRAETM